MSGREQPRSTRFFDPTSAPAVAFFAVAAIAVFVADLAKKDTSPLVLDVRAFMGEPWRIFTTSLPHANVLHLAFNLLWLVRLGAPIEARLGTVRFAIFALLVDGGASVAEYALGGSGVGLSGLVYAMAGFAWVARHDPRFAGLVDRRTALIFGGWFLFCIGTTMTGAMRVANVAHGAGAVFGGLAGVVLARPRVAQRIAAGISGAVLLGLSWLGATTYRPLVNFTKDRGGDSAHLGWKHLDADDPAAALPFLREAVRIAPHDASNWHNLGVALGRLDDDAASLAAFHRAYDLRGDADGAARLGRKHLAANEPEVALQFLREATTLAPNDASNWFRLSTGLERLGDDEGSLAAYHRGHELKGDATSAAYLAFRHLEARRPGAALPYLHEAALLASDDASNWHNLAVALGRLDDAEGSLDAFRRAHAVQGDADSAKALSGSIWRASDAAFAADDAERLAELCAEGERLAPDDFRRCSREARLRRITGIGSGPLYRLESSGSD